MSKYRQFIFKDYAFDPESRSLKLYYAYDDVLEFCETYTFAFDFADYDEKVLDRAVQLLFFMAGVSYFKTYVAPEIVVQKGEIDEPLGKFLERTYQKGLGEFFYVNKLDPRAEINFPVNSEMLPVVSTSPSSGLLIGIGGGKDSLITAELLRSQPKVATWSLNHRSQLTPLVERVGMPHFWVEREWDQQLKTLNETDALNGHVPISAIIACVGEIVAILAGHQAVVVSNENSANEPTLHYDGMAINHQYSKSLEFETDFQRVLAENFGDSIHYFSFLRPLSELRIGELFAKVGMEKYQGVFSSCNRAYTHGQDHIFWCGQCPKCAFVFLVLTPFVDRPKLEQLWGGKNLLLDPALETTYRQLLGIVGDKPLECVGEIKETRAAMRLAQKIYPELDKYQFELPPDYDYKQLYPHRMPEELYSILKNAVNEL